MWAGAICVGVGGRRRGSSSIRGGGIGASIGVRHRAVCYRRGAVTVGGSGSGSGVRFNSLSVERGSRFDSRVGEGSAIFVVRHKLFTATLRGLQIRFKSADNTCVTFTNIGKVLKARIDGRDGGARVGVGEETGKQKTSVVDGSHRDE